LEKSIIPLTLAKIFYSELMKFLPFFFLAGLGLFASVSFAQRGKDGNVTVNTANRIVNEYTTLTADAFSGNTTITVAASGLNPNGRFSGLLAPGDLIMIIQMRGISANGSVVEFPAGSGTFYGIPNDITWGQINSYNNCGRYEFCEVRTVPNATSITLDCGLQYDYTASGRVQVIRVPRYNTLTVTAPGSITCPAWATGGIFTGGVVSVEVFGNTLINNTGGINVSSMGFRGGSLVGDNNTLNGGGQVAMQNSAEGAEKGEGVYGYQADYNLIGGRYCRGAAGNAGGGGNGHNAGGGGGANAGNISGWDGLGNPDLSGGAGWVAAWNLEGGSFSTHTSSGGGRGGYTFSNTNNDATTVAPRAFQAGGTNAWGGDYRTNSGGLGGRPLDYSGGRIFMGGGGGAGDQNSNAGGVGGRGAGLVYLMSYGTVGGSGTITANGGNGANAGIDGAGGGGAGGTVIINSVGTVSGISVSANGGNGGNQIIGFSTVQGEGPGGSGGGGYIAVSTGAITQTANPGNNGTTDSNHFNEFPPNGATRGAAGLTSQSITNYTIAASGVTICAGNTATLTATLSGTVPPGTTFNWWDAQTGGNLVGSGSPWVTPVLGSTTTYYVGTCPGTYRIPVVVTVNPGLTITVNSATVCGTVTTTLTANGGTTYTWSAGATSTGVNTATVSPSATTSYTVTGTTGSCSGTAVATITVNAAPVATFSYTGTPYCQNATNPSPAFSGGGVAGTFSSTPGLSINSGTGVVNLSASTAGTYTVTNTIPAGGGCPAVSATSSITITAVQAATFSYTASPYCQSAANPSPVFSGGGVAGTFSSTAGLSLNPGTGAVNLALSTPGTYTVTNTIAASGGCPTVTANSNITITAQPVATFSYTGSPYCSTAANPSPTFSGGGVAGTFTSTAGLSITAGTGVVNLAASTPGTYTVTNTIPAAGGCPAATATANITITNPSIATFSYVASPYCQTATDPAPTFSGGGTAGTFTSTGGLSIAAGTGIVDLSASTPGTYTVTNTIAASGGCPAATATSNITITAQPVATFSYTATPYCQNEADPAPVFSGGGVAGTFTSTAGLSISAANGLVDLSASTPGTYTVTNTIAASGGCPAVTATSPITITAQPVATFSYTASPYCQSSADPSPVFSGGGIAGTFTSTAGLNIAAGTGVVDLSASTPGTYTVTNTIAASGGCPVTTATSSITITAAQTAAFSYAGTPFCQDAPDPSPVLVAGSIAGTYSSTAGLSINSTNGAIDLSASTAGTYTVTNTIAASGGCPVVTATSSVTINPVQNAAFSYTSSTFCASGSNPVPTITGTSGGSFSSSPAGLTIDGTTGTITLATSTLNTYSVTYTTPGPCPASTSINVTISNSPSATFSYTASPYCQNATDPVPTFSGGGTAGTFSSTGGLVFVSSATGEVDLSASTPGTYTVTNTIPASGGCAAASATSSITISPAQSAAFGYAASPYCQNGTDPSPVFTGGSVAGTFTSTSGLSINAATGLVDLSASTAGTYTVLNTISGSCGTVDSATITITLPSDATITQPASICAGAAAFNLSAATAGGTWTGTGITDGTNGTFDPSAAGTGLHVITYTLGGFCGGVDTVTINVTSVLDATIVNPGSVCVASPAFNLSAATSGGVWTGTGITNGAAGTFDPATAGTGTFTITYTISGACGSTDTALIVVTTNSDATITQPAPVCEGSAAFNFMAATPGGTWSGPGITNPILGTFDPSLSGGGPHMISYNIIGSCSSIDTVFITVLTSADPTINSVTGVCTGTPPFNMSAANSGGTWSGTGITDTTNGTFSPAVSGTGTFTVTYTMSGFCANMDTVLVTVNPPADATIISVLPVCANATPFNLTAATSGGVWSGTGITNSASGTFDPGTSGAGTFAVTYVIAGACGDTDVQNIVVNSIPNPDATPDIFSGCAPLCVQFTETTGTNCNTISYDFADGSTSASSDPSHCFNNAGSYSVSISCTDINGCTGTNNISSTINVSSAPSADMSISPSGIVAPNTAVTFTDVSAGGGNQLWNFGDPSSATNTSFLSSDIHTYVTEGTYCIVLYSSNTAGCVDSVTECIIVAGDVTLSVPNVFTPNGDGNNDEFFISSTGVKALNCSIYDRWGLKVAQLGSVNERWNGRTTSGSMATDGVYYYILDVTGLNDKTVQKQGFIQLLSTK
jgi:gliding motility-associated-like protein